MSVLIAVPGAVGVLGSSPAYAVRVDPATGPDHELPFLCGESWRGSTRASHSPSTSAVDFNAPGDEGHVVLASAPGVVTQVVTSSRGYGNHVVIDHGATATDHDSLYAHLQSTHLLVGTRIDQGQPIGLLGESGNASGPHLHFEERLDRDVFAPYFSRTRWQMGSTGVSQNCPDTPLMGDWDGNRKTNIGLVRHEAAATMLRKIKGNVAWGTGWDRFFTGDWDGDGRTDLGLRAPGSSRFVLRAADGTTTSIRYGSAGAVTVTGDWDGDRRTDLGGWRPDLGRFALRSADGRSRYLTFGSAGDEPVTGDWDGDRITDVGVWRAGMFLLRTGASTIASVPLGQPGDLPVTGDWNGDRHTDVGVWNPSTATFTLQTLDRSTHARAGAPKTVRYGRARG